MSGPALGRPPAHLSKEKKKQALADERIRNAIEGKFGQAKRRFSLARVMAKLDNTSQTTIAIAFLVINLACRGIETMVIDFFVPIFINNHRLCSEN